MKHSKPSYGPANLDMASNGLEDAKRNIESAADTISQTI
jgi:hypothetical protein